MYILHSPFSPGDKRGKANERGRLGKGHWFILVKMKKRRKKKNIEWSVARPIPIIWTWTTKEAMMGIVGRKQYQTWVLQRELIIHKENFTRSKTYHYNSGRDKNRERKRKMTNKRKTERETKREIHVFSFSLLRPLDMVCMVFSIPPPLFSPVPESAPTPICYSYIICKRNATHSHWITG